MSRPLRIKCTAHLQWVSEAASLLQTKRMCNPWHKCMEWASWGWHSSLVTLSQEAAHSACFALPGIDAQQVQSLTTDAECQKSRRAAWARTTVAAESREVHDLKESSHVMALGGPLGVTALLSLPLDTTQQAYNHSGSIRPARAM